MAARTPFGLVLADSQMPIAFAPPREPSSRSREERRISSWVGREFDSDHSAEIMWLYLDTNRKGLRILFQRVILATRTTSGSLTVIMRTPASSLKRMRTAGAPPG